MSRICFILYFLNFFGIALIAQKPQLYQGYLTGRQIYLALEIGNDNEIKGYVLDAQNLSRIAVFGRLDVQYDTYRLYPENNIAAFDAITLIWNRNSNMLKGQYYQKTKSGFLEFRPMTENLDFDRSREFLYFNEFYRLINETVGLGSNISALKLDPNFGNYYLNQNSKYKSEVRKIELSEGKFVFEENINESEWLRYHFKLISIYPLNAYLLSAEHIRKKNNTAFDTVYQHDIYFTVFEKEEDFGFGTGIWKNVSNAKFSEQLRDQLIGRIPFGQFSVNEKYLKMQFKEPCSLQFQQAKIMLNFDRENSKHIPNQLILNFIRNTEYVLE
jgi:hypothetical protein